jgi:hypothetical protein
MLQNAPAGMQIGMHLCRGNRGGQWHSEGSYVQEQKLRLVVELARDIWGEA